MPEGKAPPPNMRASGRSCIRRGRPYCVELLHAWRGRQRGEVEPPRPEPLRGIPAPFGPDEGPSHGYCFKAEPKIVIFTVKMTVIKKKRRISAFSPRGRGRGPAQGETVPAKQNIAIFTLKMAVLNKKNGFLHFPPIPVGGGVVPSSS